jgi:hypothetical protein
VKQAKVAQILGGDDKRRSRNLRGPSGDGDQFDGIDDANRRLSKA